MKKFLAVVTPMVMAFNLLTVRGSNMISTETIAAAASGAASEEETTEKEVEESEPAVETTGADSTQLQSSILFCGSTSLYPILSSLAPPSTKKYMTWDAVGSSFPNSNVSVYVVPDGSGVGASVTIDGTADFSVLARDIKDSEIEVLGEHYQEFVVTKDVLTVSVNAENPIYSIMDDMPAETIHQIFAGKAATWDQVDSTLPAKTINVYIRNSSGGAYEVFQKGVMGDSEVTASVTQSTLMTELVTNIVEDKRGIGYVGFGVYNKASADGQASTAIKVGGVGAMAGSTINGAHIIQRPVMFVVGVKITPFGQAFIDHIFSQAGYDVVEANGYIPAFTSEA